MIALVPYFAALITLLFSVGFLMALKKFREDE